MNDDMSIAVPAAGEALKLLGYDASGNVAAVGPDATSFGVGATKGKIVLEGWAGEVERPRS